MIVYLPLRGQFIWVHLLWVSLQYVAWSML